MNIEEARQRVREALGPEYELTGVKFWRSVAGKDQTVDNYAVTIARKDGSRGGPLHPSDYDFLYEGTGSSLEEVIESACGALGEQ